MYGWKGGIFHCEEGGYIGTQTLIERVEDVRGEDLYAECFDTGKIVIEGAGGIGGGVDREACFEMVFDGPCARAAAHGYT